MPAAARKSATSGRCPWRHRLRNRWVGSSRPPQPRVGGGEYDWTGSGIAGLPPFEMLLDAIQRTLQLLAPRPRRAAESAGDLGPCVALGTEVGQLPLLDGHQAAELVEHLLPGDQPAGAGGGRRLPLQVHRIPPPPPPPLPPPP